MKIERSDFLVSQMCLEQGALSGRLPSRMKRDENKFADSRDPINQWIIAPV